MKIRDTEPEASAEHPSRPSWRKLFKSTEGGILLLGIAIALAGLIIMGLVAFWSPQTSRMIGAMSVSNIMFGSIVSMSIGYTAGYGYALVITVNMWVEIVMLLLFYPVFVFSMRKLVMFPKLKRVLDSTQAAAERHHDKVRRYGVLGLFIFVWFPFWMTGPLVGSAIGFLLGFPAWLTLSVVIVGNFFTMAGWAYLLFAFYARASAFGPWAPVLMISVIILFVIAGYFLNRREKKRNIRVSFAALFERIKNHRSWFNRKAP